MDLPDCSCWTFKAELRPESLRTKTRTTSTCQAHPGTPPATESSSRQTEMAPMTCGAFHPMDRDWCASLNTKGLQCITSRPGRRTGSGSCSRRGDQEAVKMGRLARYGKSGLTAQSTLGSPKATTIGSPTGHMPLIECCSNAEGASSRIGKSTP